MRVARMDGAHVHSEVGPNAPRVTGVQRNSEALQPFVVSRDDGSRKCSVKSVGGVVRQVKDADRPSVAERVAPKSLVGVDRCYCTDLGAGRSGGEGKSRNEEQAQASGEALSG